MKWPHPCWIVSTPRSGSTWLCGLLNLAVGGKEHPKPPVQDLFGEHFHPTLGHVYPNYWVRTTKVHVHWIADALLIQELPPPQTKIIWLTRRDHLQQAWSIIAASRLGLCNTNKEEERDSFRARLNEVTASHEEYMTHIQAIEQWERLGNSLFANYDRLCLSYEELQADTEGQVGRIMEFLEVPEWEFKASTHLKLMPN